MTVPERAQFGVGGLDKMLHGGLIAGSMALLQGAPGTGKTTLGMQFLVEGVVQGKADAVLAASIFHFGEHTVGEAKRHMAEHGIEVRL